MRDRIQYASGRSRSTIRRERARMQSRRAARFGNARASGS